MQFLADVYLQIAPQIYLEQSTLINEQTLSRNILSENISISFSKNLEHLALVNCSWQIDAKSFLTFLHQIVFLFFCPIPCTLSVKHSVICQSWFINVNQTNFWLATNNKNYVRKLTTKIIREESSTIQLLLTNTKFLHFLQYCFQTLFPKHTW